MNFFLKLLQILGFQLYRVEVWHKGAIAAEIFTSYDVADEYYTRWLQSLTAGGDEFAIQLARWSGQMDGDRMVFDHWGGFQMSALVEVE